MRAPYQILAFPYIKSSDGTIKYCLFKRNDLSVWQGIAGGGEEGETPLETAKREANEEAGIPMEYVTTQLSSIASIPVEAISGFIWGEDIIVIPEYTFGIEVMSEKISLSDEHRVCEWLSFDDAHKKLEWDSNRTALWELNHRLTHNKLANIKQVL